MAKRFRFIHCADLHLGTPLAIREAPSRYWEKTLRDATFQAFRNIVDTAIEKRVAAIVIAGDVYNSAATAPAPATRSPDRGCRAR